MNERIIIDTDPGIDDALALILALKSNLDIKAISTVAGNVGLGQAQANAQYLLSKLKSGIKPIPGAQKPLENDLVTAPVHGKNGLGTIDIKPVNISSNIAKIISTIEKQNINTIVTLGPLTNIAEILKTSPELENQINQIIIMGGAVNSPGNITPEAEFNIYVDPEATQIVFNSKIKKTLVPLKVCHQVILKEKFFRRIKDKDLRELVTNIVREYIKNNHKQGINGAPMYDPLTVYYLINKQAYRTENTKLTVTTSGEKRGKTEISKDGSQINVAVDIDEAKFKQDFIGIINKG